MQSHMGEGLDTSMPLPPPASHLPPPALPQPPLPTLRSCLMRRLMAGCKYLLNCRVQSLTRNAPARRVSGPARGGAVAQPNPSQEPLKNIFAHNTAQLGSDASRQLRQTQVTYLDRSTPLELLSDLSEASDGDDEELAADDGNTGTDLPRDEGVDDDDDDDDDYEDEDEDYEDEDNEEEWINNCKDLLEGELRELAKEYVAYCSEF